MILDGLLRCAPCPSGIAGSAQSPWAAALRPTRRSISRHAAFTSPPVQVSCPVTHPASPRPSPTVIRSLIAVATSDSDEASWGHIQVLRTAVIRTCLGAADGCEWSSPLWRRFDLVRFSADRSIIGAVLRSRPGASLRSSRSSPLDEFAVVRLPGRGQNAHVGLSSRLYRSFPTLCQ
jgi:hypothetical protein